MKKNKSKIIKEEEEEEDGVKGFFACYLLTSLSPRHKGHTYIGYTVNPRRRIRQHNGEIGCGAWRTKRKRPWEMVLCIYGFPTNVSALQFEWAWQHPTESLAVRTAAASFKTLGGLGNKVKLAFTMLTLSKWQDLDLTVNFFSSKYTMHSAGSPTLPEQMSVQVCSMDELPCYTGIYNPNEDDFEDEDRDDLNAEDLLDEMGIMDIYANEGSMNVTDGNDLYKSKNSADNTDEHEYEDRDDLDASNFVVGTGIVNASINTGFTNTTVVEHMYSKSSGKTTSYGVGDSFVDKSYDSSNWTENDMPDFGIENEPEDYLMGSKHLHNLQSDKEDGVVKNQHKRVMLATIGVSNDQPAANNLIASQEVEIIDLSSPSPGYRVDLKRKRRKVSGGVIDLTNSPIFVEV